MNDWQRQNLHAIQQRLAWVQQQPNGPLFQKIRPTHIVVVEKKGNKLRLGLPSPVSKMVQSVLNLDDPLNLTAPYNQTFLLTLLWKPNPDRVFSVGVGGGCFLLVLHHYLTQTKFDGAELDSVVLEVAQNFFGLPCDDRFDLVVQEASLCLTEKTVKYDLIFVDVFMGSGLTPYQFVTQEFYELCIQRLQEDGMIALNIAHDWPYFAEKIRTLQSVFKYVYIFRVEMGNSAVLATNGEFINAADLVERTRALQDEHRFLFSLLKRAKVAYLPNELHEIVPHLAEAAILHDHNRPDDYPLEPPKLHK